MFGEHERRIFGPYSNGTPEGQRTWGDPEEILFQLTHALNGEPNRYLRELVAGLPVRRAGDTTPVTEQEFKRRRVRSTCATRPP
jgi:hypothetical protein